MKTKLLILFFAIYMPVFPFTVTGQVPQIQLNEKEWIRNWLLCGPFPLQQVAETTSDFEHQPGFETDFLYAHGGETHLRVKAGQVEKVAGEAKTWFIHSSADSCIDLDAAVSRQDFVAAYGYCEIISPDDRVSILALGTNDGGRLWLNGEKIWDRTEGRGLQPDDDLIPVFLQKGRNTLLIKVEERGNRWGFCMRFLPFKSDLFLRQSSLFKVVPQNNGGAVLRFQCLAPVLQQVLKTVHIRLSSAQKPAQLIWQHDWNRKREMSLPVERKRYGNYLLLLEFTLVDGRTWSTELQFMAGKRTDYVLFDRGKTDYSIVVGRDASASEKWAAQELQNWLKQVSGADFPVRTDNEKITDHEIVVGFNEHTRKLIGANMKPPPDDDESFVYKNAGSRIVIIGGKQRGTMYGVMTFLEKEFGCRWYSPTVTVIPKKEQYVFHYLNHSESPTIRVRNDFYFEAFDPTWAARNKMNGVMNYREQPGGVEGYWSVHTFYKFMPPAEFFNSHPEYYSLIDGKRVHERAQLCLTNPDVLSIVVKRLKQTMREHPEYLIYSVSQNDWGNPCQCEKCQAIARREGSEAGPVIWFVNRVAERIEKEFPDKYVGTLAYTYSRKPCKTIHPRENVVVRLCSIECCFAHDFNSCPENASFVSDLDGWARISPHLYIWDYVVNFSHYILPFPNFRVLQPNIKTLRAHKAIGIMEQADYQSRGGEFAELRAYVIAKLLWNPDSDIEQIIDDFMYGYYGRSGQYVRQYFDLLQNRITPATHIHLGLQADDKLFSDEFVQKATAIFDQAKIVAENETIRKRVEMAGLPVLYLKCKRSPVRAKYDGTYDLFNKIVAREGITYYAERGKAHREAFHKEVEAAK